MTQPRLHWREIDDRNIMEYQQMFTLPETFGVRQMVTMELLRERRNPETKKLEYQITHLGIQAASLVRNDPVQTNTTLLVRTDRVETTSLPSV